MTIQTGEDALPRAIDAIRAHEQLSGGHAWGYATFDDQGEFTARWGTGYVPADLELPETDAEIALAHTRFATRGTLTTANAHPFVIYDKTDDGPFDVPLAYLAHNGTWHEAPKNSDRCDSWFIARVLESVHEKNPQKPFDELVQLVGDVTGETFVVLHRDGQGYVHAGRYGITDVGDGVSSSGGTAIPEGSVRVI